MLLLDTRKITVTIFKISLVTDMVWLCNLIMKLASNICFIHMKATVEDHLD